MTVRRAFAAEPTTARADASAVECGAPLAVPCGSSWVLRTSQVPSFCGGCGARTRRGARYDNPEASRHPQAYTPKHLAEKILTSKAALEGERKQVTVLFADLKGSMELLADRDPEEARKLLDPVLERMMDAVHRYEGTVNQVMGDGIMALFGAPLAHEDHAVRACYAALRMQDTVKRYAEGVRRAARRHDPHPRGPELRRGRRPRDRLRSAHGLHRRRPDDAPGRPHGAARRSRARSLITPETLALAEGYVEVKSLGPVPVKGLADAVEVYEVTGAGPVRTRLQAAAGRGLTRFVGRDAELEQLRDALDQASQGRGQVVAVVGEPGVGKSRLFWELTHSHRVHGWLIVAVRLGLLREGHGLPARDRAAPRLLRG